MNSTFIRSTPAVIIVGGLLALGLSVYGMTMHHELLPNPDPNHTHADFAVWVNGTALDFSVPEYMSSVPKATQRTLPLVPRAHAHEDAEEGPALPGREYLHLHDGNGHVIHRHKPGLTLGDFFASIGLTMTTECFRLDQHQLEAMNQSWMESYNLNANLCNSGKFHWTMIVNATEVPMNPDYEFQDLDKILLTYSAGDDHSAEWELMTDDACMSSLRCPWKGTPPKENCISDPTIPCVVPESAMTH